MNALYDATEQAWRFTAAAVDANGDQGNQWIGWSSATFVNRQFRATFQAKLLSAWPDIDLDGFIGYHQLQDDQWLTDAAQNVGSWVSADVVATVPLMDPAYGASWEKVLLIFDGAPVDVLIKDFAISFCDSKELIDYFDSFLG